MNNIYGIVFLAVICIALAIYLYDRYRGTNHFVTLVIGKPVLTALTSLAKAVSATTNSEYFVIAYKILDATAKAVVEAENLYKMGELAPQEREAYAQKLIAHALSEAGVVITDERQKMINGIISLVCLLLPHSNATVEQLKEEDDSE